MTRIALATFIGISAVALAYLARPLLLPVAYALTLGLLLAPLRERLERRLPTGVVAPLLALIPPIAFGVAIGAVATLLRSAPGTLAESTATVEEWTRRVLAETRDLGIPVPKADGSLVETLAGTLASLGLGMTQLLAMSLLAEFFLLLGLLERKEWLDKLGDIVGSDHLDTYLTNLATSVRAYYLTRTVACALSGVASGGMLALLGVPGAGLFGALVAVMNYLPNIGSWLAAVPAVAIATATQGVQIGVATAAGLFLIEQMVGNLVDPLLQGKQVGLAPTVVLASVVAWGMLWGLPGALIAVPLTLAIATWLELDAEVAAFGRLPMSRSALDDA